MSNNIVKKPISPHLVGASRAKKEQIVAKLIEKMAKAKSVVFTNYQGLSHKQLEELKRGLRGENAELTVTKNTLLKLALNSSQFKGYSPEDTSFLENPTATLFVYNEVVAPLKQIARTIKSLGLPSIKFGIIDNQMLTGDQVLKLASLPVREVLLAQVVRGLESPIFGLHRALSWNLQKLVMTLSVIQQKNPKS